MQRFSVPVAAAAGSGIMRWVRRAAGRLGRRSEWEALSGEDRRQLSADIGISDTELNAVVRDGSNSRELMALLARPALRRLTYPLDVLRDMQRVCSFCPHHRRCRAWQTNAGFAARWPAFCQNAHTFASLRRPAGTGQSGGSVS